MAGQSDHVRALARGLSILRFVNSAGSSKAGEISQVLKIPRPTVYRLLQTLEEEGYIKLSSTDSRVRVTALAASLSDNITGRSLVCQVAGPALHRFTKEQTWPIDLSTYEDGHMVIQETTHAKSALSVDRGMTGYPLPMLRSSAGRAYLGACPPDERHLILELVRSFKLLEDIPMLQSEHLKEQHSFFCKQGYSVRGPQTFRPKTSSIAVPILLENRVAACVSTIWVSKAMTMDEATTHYVEPLREVACKIAELLQTALKST